MKHLLTLFFFSSFWFQLYAQGGAIVSLSVSPPNPTVSDEIEVYANVSFPSGGCDLDFIAYPLNGTTINASAHHCVGLLTVICNTTDTFELGQLPAGNYTFDLTLTSGAGGPNCTPGIVADDNDQLQFIVSPSVGIDELEYLEDFIYPNPVSDVFYLKRPFASTAIITDADGKRVGEIPSGNRQVDLSHLPNGIYVLQIGNSRLKLVKVN